MTTKQPADHRTVGIELGVGIVGALLGIGSLWYSLAGAIAANVSKEQT